MPLNPIQLPQRAPKKDTWDKVLMGLQIAEGVFKIPVAYQQYKKTEEEREVLQDERAGKYTIGSAAKAGLKFTPDAPAPDPAVMGPPSPLKPPRFSMLPSYQGQIVGEGGALLPGKFTSAEAEKLAVEQEDKLRSRYGEEDPIKILKQAQQNYANVENGLRSGNKEGQTLALLNIARLYNPGVSRVGDVQAAETVPEIIKKGIARLTGASANPLDKTEVANYMQLAKQGIATNLQVAEPTIARYKQLAEQSGFLPENIGIEDYSKYKQEEKPKLTPRSGMEGRTATNPKTGEQIVFRGGKWVPTK